MSYLPQARFAKIRETLPDLDDPAAIRPEDLPQNQDGHELGCVKSWRLHRDP